jgi:flagellar biosynthesis/type III secretory pathway protein FliH
MNFDGPKKQGRFIKKGAKVLEKISLVEFNFEEINTTNVIHKDNATRSIIHADYHPKDEISDRVADPHKFDQDLVPSDQRRSILMPIDFTKQWRRDAARRASGDFQKEDDEYEYELRLIQQHEQEREERKRTLAKASGADKNSPTSAAVEIENIAEEVKTPVIYKSVPDDAQIFSAAGSKAVPGGGPMVTGSQHQWQYMEAVGEAIKGLKNTATDPPSQPPQRPGREPGAIEDEFIPVSPGPSHASSNEVTDPEQAAMRTYRDRLEEEKQQEKKWAEAAEIAKAQGYRDGFRAGEEKAELQMRETAQQIFGNLNELVQEFSSLKKNILENVQENFYELCQAMAEALIKREFSINTETFMMVLQRAITESVEPGKIRVHVHPELFDRVAAVAPPDLKEALLKDGEIAVGDFKIESSMSVVDVNVTKLVSELLRQADLDLFKQGDNVA